MAYTAAVVAISAVYLYMNWGVHSTYVATRQDLLEHTDGTAAGLEGMAFTESGGAEYILVVLYFFFHVVVLGLLLAGRGRNIVMGVACALLLACSMMYVLFYGCLLLQSRMEQYQSLNSPGGVPLRKPAPQAPYRLTTQDVDRTIASGSAGADGVVEATAAASAAAPVGGGTCKDASSPEAALSYSNLGWTVVETLVDVLAAIVAGPDEADVGADRQRYHPDGMPIAEETPFSSIRRKSLLWMSVVGFVLSIWGVSSFDLSPEGVGKAANPGLTASALSQLSSSSSAKQNGKSEKSIERRRERAAAALQEAASTSVGTEAKKNQ